MGTTSTINSGIALIDGNNFYVSCERVFNPSLRRRLSSCYPIMMAALYHAVMKPKP